MKRKVVPTTLLDLVVAVQDSARTDTEVVAIISRMLRSGRVRLIGTFARTAFARGL